MRWSAQQVVGGNSQTAAPVGAPTPALQQPVQSGVVGTTAPAQAGPVQGQSVPSMSSGPVDVSGTVSAAGSPLSGWGALAGGLPGGTGESPVVLAMLGYARKESEKTAAGDPSTSPTATTPTSATLTSQGVAAQTSGASLTNAPTATLQTQQSARSPGGDTTPPTVSLTEPTNSATVSGTVNLKATATDNVKVAGVQFKVDGKPVGTEDTKSPYSVSWNTNTATNGSHTLTAVARDAAGNTSTSNVTVTVDNAAPTVSFTAPANVSGTVTLGATATDNAGGSGVAGVQFKLDGIDLGAEDKDAPYSVSWNTTTANNGPHTLTTRARDAAGNITEKSVSVTVDNAAPTVSVTPPATGAPVSGSTVAVDATASDNVGVAGVQFQLDGANLGAEDPTAPYSVSWDTTAALNGTHILTAVARDAAGNTTTSAQVSVTVDNPVPELAIIKTMITVNGYPSDVAVSGDYVYVSNFDAGAVWAIDPTTNTVVGDPIPVGIYPMSVVPSEQGDRVYIPDYGTYGYGSGVAVLDTDPTSPTYHDVTFIPVTVEDPPYYCDGNCYYGVKGVAVSSDGSRVYAFADDGYVSVIDTATKTVISRHLIGGYSEMAVSEDGTRLYAWPYVEFYGSASTQVDVYDTATMTKVGAVAVKPEYRSHDVAVAINPDGTRAYAVVRDPSTGYGFKLSVIDIDPTSSTYNTEIAVVNVPSSYGVIAIDVALNSDGFSRICAQ